MTHYGTSPVGESANANRQTANEPTSGDGRPRRKPGGYGSLASFASGQTIRVSVNQPTD